MRKGMVYLLAAVSPFAQPLGARPGAARLHSKPKRSTFASRLWPVWCLLVLLGVGVLTVPIAVRESPRARLAHDEQTLGAIRAAIAAYQRMHGSPPGDKAAVEALLRPPPAWRCTGQEWIYEPASGRARLLIPDLPTCQTP